MLSRLNFFPRFENGFLEDNNLWFFIISSWMGQMCSDIGNIKIRLWTFQRFERLFAIIIFNFGSNEMIWMKWRLILFPLCTSVSISQILGSWYEEMKSLPRLYKYNFSEIWFLDLFTDPWFLISNCNLDEMEIIFWQVFPIQEILKFVVNLSSRRWTVPWGFTCDTR